MSENTAERKSAIKPYRAFKSAVTKTDVNVYIITKSQLAEVEEIKNEHDVVVLDYRKNADPNMQVRDSYKITNNDDQDAIIKILLDYNDQNPVEPAWLRTPKSLNTEWDIHNLAYHVGFMRDHSADVDFNNGAE